MLVLSRHKNEGIVLGSNAEIEVVVVEIRHDKVRLGIKCPPELPVHRREIYDLITSRGEPVKSNASELKS
jgi:carbon storage regulator